jgi:transcriptional regulator with XRE-family HTH domain
MSKIYYSGMEAKELEREREKLGWTKTKLADKLGVSIAIVSLWERGIKPIPKLAALALAKVFEKAR